MVARKAKRDLTISDVKEALALIQRQAQAKDFESARNTETTLHENVLIAISTGSQHPYTLARVALKSRKIKFARHAA